MSTTELRPTTGAPASSVSRVEQPTVSVIVPTWNRGAYLPHLFAALSRQIYPSDRVELVVVDNSSDDDTDAVVAEWAALLPFPVRFHRKVNDGPAASRNVGASMATGEVLAFTDSDCIPEPQWLANGVRHLAKTDIVAGPMYGLSGEHDGKVAFQGKQTRTDDGTFPTGNLLLWRSWFERVGGFDERYGIYPWGGLVAGEDTDMVWRAKRLGAQTAFFFDVPVGHQPTPAGSLREVLLAPTIVQIFPHLLRSIPELRRTKLHRSYFLSREQLRYDLALVGVLTAVVTRRWSPLLATVPFVSAVRPNVRREAKLNGRRAAAELLAVHVYSGTANLAVLLASSVRNRRLVL